MKWFRKNKNDNYPDYWNSYADLFKNEEIRPVAETKFIVLDSETTGFNYSLDRIISIGALVVQNNIIEISETFEIYVDQDRFNPKTIEIHGILRNERLETLSEQEAIEQFLRFIGNNVLVAHHAHFDITMINNALGRNGLPNLKNKVLDTATLYRASRIKTILIDEHQNYTLDAIAENYGIDLSDRHTAAGDALITALVFLKTLSRLNSGKTHTLKELLSLK